MVHGPLHIQTYWPMGNFIGPLIFHGLKRTDYYANNSDVIKNSKPGMQRVGSLGNKGVQKREILGNVYIPLY